MADFWENNMPYRLSRLIDNIRQSAAADMAMLEWWDLTEQEMNCWRMFGIRAEWVMDELIIYAP
jgi:hypothetical protein